MLKFALKLAVTPVLLLAAMPAHSMEKLSRGLTVSPVESPFSGFDTWSQRSNVPQKLYGLNELSDPTLTGPSRSNWIGQPGPVAAIMPEPMSWAMMILGLTVVGGSIRLLQRRAGYRISFV